MIMLSAKVEIIHCLFCLSEIFKFHLEFEKLFQNITFATENTIFLKNHQHHFDFDIFFLCQVKSLNIKNSYSQKISRYTIYRQKIDSFFVPFMAFGSKLTNKKLKV
ncbi:hypothetical protein BpHYR1_044027 [Brachionus plicatilis]|uniref:Uncharacterized protein n=1 Tax=Brachionus plicatilis TaxID=10195 RepID=A0A3M7SHX2_BRAPC|nr:hypothetical protein BpHYR1_044027 [Brachionus plicatilis]